MIEFLKETRKFIVALCGAAVIAVDQGLIHGTTAKWITLTVIFLTALGVYVVPNQLKERQPNG